MIRARHVVVVDDEPNIGRSLRLILEGEGYRVTVFNSVAAWRAARNQPGVDVYLLDVRLPDGSGLDLLRALKQDDDRAVAVMISGHGTIADAVEATRAGAFDFLEKPLARDRVLLVVKNALERADLQRENQRFREISARNRERRAKLCAYRRHRKRSNVLQDIAPRTDIQVLNISHGAVISTTNR